MVMTSRSDEKKKRIERPRVVFILKRGEPEFCRRTAADYYHALIRTTVITSDFNVAYKVWHSKKTLNPKQAAHHAWFPRRFIARK